MLSAYDMRDAPISFNFMYEKHDYYNLFHKISPYRKLLNTALRGMRSEERKFRNGIKDAKDNEQYKNPKNKEKGGKEDAYVTLSNSTVRTDETEEVLINWYTLFANDVKEAHQRKRTRVFSMD